MQRRAHGNYHGVVHTMPRRFPGASPEQKAATGFHRNTMYNDEGGVDREPDRNERSDRDAGAGRPVQLDEEGRSRRPGTDSARPSEEQEIPK